MFIILSFFIEVVFWGFVVSMIIKSVKQHKINKSNSKPTSLTGSVFDENISNILDDSEGDEVFCAYCGAKYLKNKKRCPSCKAKNDN